MSMERKGLLRIALLYSGQVYREKVFYTPKNVVVGESHTHDLTAPVPGGKLEYKLFEYNQKEGKYNLLLTDFPGGRMKLSGRELSLEEARSEGDTRTIGSGDWGFVSLTEDERVQVFFQLVDIDEKRVGGRRRIEWQVLQTFLFALVIHLGVLFIAFMDLKQKGEMESVPIPRRFTRLLVRRPPPQTKVKKPDEVAAKRRQSLKTRRQAALDRQYLTRSTMYPSHRPRFTDARFNKGAVWAIGAARRSSAAVRRLLGSNRVDTDLENTLGQLTGRGGDGEGESDGYGEGTRAGATQGGYGATDFSGSVGTDGPIRHRGQLRDRGFKRKIPKGKLSFGSYQISGGLTRSQIQRVVSSRRGALKFCYERALRMKPEMGSGRVTANFKISPAGSVISARVVSNTLSGGGAVGSCITRLIRYWRFPASSLYTSVTYPFFFSSGLN